MRKRHVLAATLAAAAVPLGLAFPAQSHGYISTPPSRAALCAAGTVTGCGDIQWEPQSVEGPKGFPSGGPSDGTICAGGNSRFAQLDAPRGGNWPSTKVTAGQKLTFTWKFTARHATTSFRYFLTKAGYNATQPVTRANLDLTPFLTVPYNGAQPPTTLSHSATLPTGRTGHQVVVAVWEIADTGNAFYSCTDLTF
ncbi:MULTISPECIES: lytic polysaccharide monooxygenase [Streptomycetaceae]|uniref:Chitin-binding protein n=2 Tax=Kitasatospora TaxID=2063 RepID=A0A919FRD7_9ACTN|nr:MULTISPECIES: lytic polysaccharide monooxygenase [Streptomycetaceae]MDQ0309115.1 chitin-binding protein [Kitasatospora herbaricolor]OKI24367.1 chitin-binding protein [Streptomyces sp. CB03911]GGV03142.1 chitin-binding protein [Kitasatospora herbaricolor]GHH70275.1 chitin-binding protein [Kitasatospora indigofera]